jgi:hypothetical protein
MQHRQRLAGSKVEEALHTDDFGQPPRQVTDQLAVCVPKAARRIARA